MVSACPATQMDSSSRYLPILSCERKSLQNPCKLLVFTKPFDKDHCYLLHKETLPFALKLSANTFI